MQDAPKTSEGKGYALLQHYLILVPQAYKSASESTTIIS